MDEALKRLDELTNTVREDQTKTLDMLKQFAALAMKMEEELEEAKKARKEHQEWLARSKETLARRREQVKDGVYLPMHVPRYTVNVHVTETTDQWHARVYIVEKDISGFINTSWIQFIPNRVYLHLEYLLRPNREKPKFLVGEVKVHDQATGPEVDSLRKDLEKVFAS
jgi:hypothetical protein